MVAGVPPSRPSTPFATLLFVVSLRRLLTELQAGGCNNRILITCFESLPKDSSRSLIRMELRQLCNVVVHSYRFTLLNNNYRVGTSSAVFYAQSNVALIIHTRCIREFVCLKVHLCFRFVFVIRELPHNLSVDRTTRTIIRCNVQIS